MKNLIRLSSLLTMVMLLLAGATLVSCSDDDDDNNSGWPSKFSQKVVYNGKAYSIDEVYGHKNEAGGVEYYTFYLYNEEFGNDIEVSFPTRSMNKVLDLTKNQQVSGSSPVTVFINYTCANGDGAFSSGSTLIASVSGNKLKIYAKGKALKEYNFIPSSSSERAPKKEKYEFEPYTFDVQYEGTFKESGDK